MKINNILIVDNSKSSQLIIKKCLQLTGLWECQFFFASDGEEALSILKK